MKKGVFNMYTIMRNAKPRKSLYSRNSIYYPKHQDVEIKANIAHSISKDLNRGIKTCAKDISSIVYNIVGRGN